MYFKNMKIMFATLGLLITILACGFPSANPSSNGATDVPATEAPATSVAVTEVATQETAPLDQSVAIQHQIIPVSLPENQSGQASDFDSSAILETKTAIGGDRFTYGRFERPFNANTMDVYFSQLDIVNTFVSEDDTWIYGAIYLKELNSSSPVAGKYAIELDTNLDGKGDWLVTTSIPASTDWAVEGVQVYRDENHDVGSQLPTLTDENATGNGFESLVFDQGQGNDADSAWSRLSPNGSNIVEIAVKKSALSDPKKYLINMWAGTALLDPAIFDLNDHFTHEQAGAADQGLQIYYPIKSVYEIDNSCRMAVGFQPNGKEPGLCEAFIPAHEGGQDVQACQATTSQILRCEASGGQWDSASCSCSR